MKSFVRIIQLKDNFEFTLEKLDNQWSNEIRTKVLNLFANHSEPLTDIEEKIFRIISSNKQLFLGPNLNLKFYVRKSIFSLMKSDYNSKLG